MIRGTTPDLEFGIAFETSQLAAANISFSQGGRVIVERTLESMTVEGKLLSFRLTQEETLKFSAAMPVNIQGRFRLLDETALASDIIKEPVEDVQKEGVI